MTADVHSIFAYSTVSTVVSQTAPTLVITVASLDGSLFAVNTQVIIAPATTNALKSNAMIGRITGISTDTLTIDYSVGNREGSNIRTVQPTDVIVNGITPKALTDIEAAVTAAQASITANTASIAALPGNNGWIAPSGTLTYSSVDGHTFVVTTSSDLTGAIGLGDRFKVTNQSATQYFFVTAITASTMTLYGGANFTLTNTAITNPFYSHVKVPFGFPIDPTIWTEQAKNSVAQTQASPVAGTYYNLGALSLPIPIGAWHISYRTNIQVNAASNAAFHVKTTLSTTNSTESDTEMGAYQAVYVPSTSNDEMMFSEKNIILTTKTPYYLNYASMNAGPTALYTNNDLTPAIVRAVCNYL